MGPGPRQVPEAALSGVSVVWCGQLLGRGISRLDRGFGFFDTRTAGTDKDMRDCRRVQKRRA